MTAPPDCLWSSSVKYCLMSVNAGEWWRATDWWSVSVNVGEWVTLWLSVNVCEWLALSECVRMAGLICECMGSDWLSIAVNCVCECVYSGLLYVSANVCEYLALCVCECLIDCGCVCDCLCECVWMYGQRLAIYSCELCMWMCVSFWLSVSVNVWVTVSVNCVCESVCSEYRCVSLLCVCLVYNRVSSVQFNSILLKLTSLPESLTKTLHRKWV